MVHRTFLGTLALGLILLSSCANPARTDEPQALISQFEEGDVISFRSMDGFRISFPTESEAETLEADWEAYQIKLETHRQARRELENGDITQVDYRRITDENRLDRPLSTLATINEVGLDYLRVSAFGNDNDTIIPISRVSSVSVPRAQESKP